MRTGAGDPRSSPLARRTAGVLVTLVTAGAALTGCTGGSSDTADPGPSPTPTPSSSATPGPVRSSPPAAPPAVPGATGQRAFARHVMDLWGYALRTDDARPLVALGAGTRPCRGCAALAHELRTRRAQGWTVDFPGVVVHRVRLTKQGGAEVARATVDIPQSDSYTTGGGYRNTNPAHHGATFEVRMRYAHGHYTLVTFTVS